MIPGLPIPNLRESAMLRLLSTALLLAIALPALAHRTPGAPRKAAAARPKASQPATRHVLDVTLDPAAGTLRGTDTVTLPWQRKVSFRIHEGMELAATCEGRSLAIGAGADAGTKVVTIPASCKDRDGMATVAFTMSGRIVDPVTNEPSLHFVTGDRTNGLIVEEGAFLAGGTGWYPETGDLALFDARVTVPEAWSVVSQGDAHEPEPVEGGLRRFRYSSSIPADGLALSAGPYVVQSADHEGVRISTWLWKEDEAFGPPLIEAAKKEISRLTSLLGPYPGTKFDIVENFFTTGYGFPSYTLLGRDVIRMGPRALRPGYLDHEIAHVWFGNHVNVDSSQGNWCEGLTTWATNYLNTAASGEAAALESRQRVTQRYSIDVPREKDFAPSAFVTKSDDVGASIGYGKVSMIFHQLTRRLGEETTWAGLRDFVKEMGGKRASWADIEASMERVSGRDLGGFFEQWVRRAGLPELSLENVRDEGGSVSGEIVQAGQPYDLELDVEVRTILGQVITERVRSSAARTPFRIEVPAHAQRVRLDPSFHVPRRVAMRDLPPSLARTLASSKLIALHGNPLGDDAPDREVERHDALVSIARMAAGEKGRVMAAQDAATAEVDSMSVFLAGDVLENGWVRERARVFDEATGADVSIPRSFRAGARRWRSGDASLLVSADHPKLPGETLTAWVPNWFEALDAGRMIFYYGWDTWVALEGGRAKARGTIWPERSATSVVLSEMDEPGTAAGRMGRDIDALLEPRLEGRGAGTHAARAGKILSDALAKSALTPFGEGSGWEMPFEFTVRDLPGKPGLRVVPGDGGPARMIPVIPATEWLPSGGRQDAAAALGVPVEMGRLPWVRKLPRGLVFAGGPKPRFDGLDLSGAAAVVLDDGSAGATERILGWMDEAVRRNAEALVILRPEAAWPGEQELVLAASLPPPAKAERWAALEAEQGRRALHRIVTADRARLPGLPRHRDFPLFFAGAELAAEMKAAGGMTRGARSFGGGSTDLRLSFTLETIADANVVGLIEGRSGAREPAIMISAHHDGLGEAADGSFQDGAADNAAGVAVVLEVARRLAKDPPAMPVVVAFTSGEEWGLQGARAMVRDWIGGRPDLAAVVNVDSAGHAGKPLHVIGRSREPALAAIVEDAARAAGLEIGPDIDARADRDGSDHWPWVAKGVPAIDLFQADYRTINTPKDTRDKLDFDSLERLADALESSVRRIAAGR